jgi:cell division protein FtsB
MLKFYQKSRLKRLLYSPIVLLPFALLLLFLASGVWNVYSKEREARERRDRKVAELAELEQRATALETEIEKLSSERGREAEVREKFEVAREGERVIVIVEPEENGAEASPEEERTWWQKILDWLR